jgi:hypothetical protein
MSAEIVLFHTAPRDTGPHYRCDVVAFPKRRIVRLVMECPFNPMWEAWLAYCDAINDFMAEGWWKR